MFVACADDATNAAIAARAGQFIPRDPRPDSPVICRLLVRDAEIRRLWQQEKVVEWGAGAAGPHPNYHIHFNYLDMLDTAARQALQMFPLDIEPIRRANDTKRVHVVIVGGGPMGQAMMKHAARLGHFANETPARRTRITLVDTHAVAIVVAEKQRCDKWDDFCELTGRNMDPASTGFTGNLKKFLQPVAPGNPASLDELQTVVLCLETDETVREVVTPENDDENWKLGLDLMSLTRHGGRQVLVYQSTRSGFAALLSTNTADSARRLRLFGMIEDVHSQSVLLKESEYRLARAIHDDYARRHHDKTWEALEVEIQESNRHAADHAPVKLRALGFHIAPLNPNQKPIESFDDPQKKLMAKMEHERWCAERWLDGWKYGKKKDRKRKISDCLLPWEKLTPKQREKDFEQIETLPQILRSIGQGIYPL